MIPERFERSTHSLEGCCSIQLSYGTNLLSLGRCTLTLGQLSYGTNLLSLGRCTLTLGQLSYGTNLASVRIRRSFLYLGRCTLTLGQLSYGTNPAYVQIRRSFLPLGRCTLALGPTELRNQFSVAKLINIIGMAKYVEEKLEKKLGIALKCDAQPFAMSDF